MIQRLIGFLNWLQAKVDSWSANSKIYFACVFGGYNFYTPVVPARHVRPDWFKAMIERAKANVRAGTTANDAGVAKFTRCPGMHDYVQEGYLILAHADIHIKANSVTVQVNMPQVSIPELQPGPMAFDVVDGMAPIEKGVAKMAFKVPLPHGIYMERGHSAHLLPALMHSPFLDKIFVYPGTVDYDEFAVCNFIFSPIKECDFVIPAGTPLVHVLPFKRVAYHAESAQATELQERQLRFGFPSRVMGFYRRKFHSPKKYTVEEKK